MTIVLNTLEDGAVSGQIGTLINGDEEYYPGGVTDPNYCVLKFIATDGRFYSDFYPRSFVIE